MTSLKQPSTSYFVAAYPNVNVEEIGVDLSKNQNKQDTVDSSVAVRGKPNIPIYYLLKLTKLPLSLDQMLFVCLQIMFR